MRTVLMLSPRQRACCFVEPQTTGMDEQRAPCEERARRPLPAPSGALTSNGQMLAAAGKHETDGPLGRDTTTGLANSRIWPVV
jgi:hypothetical protein